MKKLLIVLMVVAMASFLFVGCLGTTPDIPDEDEEEPNQAPVITSAAITSGKVGVVYTYDVEATDPDGDVLTYSLTERPLGMSIVATTGLIGWFPTDAGIFGVGVKVSDGELTDTQGFSITVAAADEPEPEPELQLIGIEVDPKDMDLFVGGFEEIISVTATYEIRGYEVILDPADCIFLSSDLDVATVEEVAGIVTVTAEGVGTADIVVSYGGKVDTLEVTVTSQGSMEIIADIPIFTLVGPPVTDQIEEFTIEIVANDDVNKEVLFLFTLPVPAAPLDYILLPPVQWGVLPLIPGFPYSIQDSLFDEELIFEITFPMGTTITATTVYETTIEVRTFTENVLLCSKDITIIVYVP